MDEVCHEKMIWNDKNCKMIKSFDLRKALTSKKLCNDEIFLTQRNLWNFAAFESKTTFKWEKFEKLRKGFKFFKKDLRRRKNFLEEDLTWEHDFKQKML